MARHPNLSDEINDALEDSEKYGGVYLKDLRVGDALEVQTQNTLYHIKKLSDKEFEIEGNKTYCPKPTKCRIVGSTWGGSMLKMEFVGRNMYLEFYTEGHKGRILTSQIKTIKTNRVH